MTEEKKPETEQCHMVTYDGFFIMAGLPPRGAKKERCPEPAVKDGYCEKHDPEFW